MVTTGGPRGLVAAGDEVVDEKALRSNSGTV